MSNDSDGESQETAPEALILFGLIAILVGADVVADSLSGTTPIHLLAELSATALALTGVALLWRRMQAVRRAAASLGHDLRAAREEAERWRREAGDVLRGLGVAIDRQFERWGLTSAERGIALLLLKGLSHKEVSTVRDTTERTVRQQSLAIYRKAGLAGRAELAAFFLEDLLLPVRLDESHD
jgi:DNA-binding CsgD family transcriptional regulator